MHRNHYISWPITVQMRLWITPQLALFSRPPNHRIFRPKSQKLNQGIEAPTALPCFLKDTSSDKRN